MSALPAGMVNWTDIVVILGVAIALGWDAWLFAKKGETATISWRVGYWSTRAPIIAVLVGILVGHLFWPNHAYCQ